MSMPHQQPRAPKATRWRDVRAKALKAGRLDEQAVAAHTRRMRAATNGYALAERRQAAGLTRAQLATRLPARARRPFRPPRSGAGMNDQQPDSPNGDDN